MNGRHPFPWRSVQAIARPILLFEGALLFALGAAMAAYLGQRLPAGTYLAGQAIVTLLQLSTHSLHALFSAPGDRLEPGRRLAPIRQDEPGIPLRWLMALSAAGLTVSATLVGWLLVTGRLPVVAALILAAGVFTAYALCVPPARAIDSAYGSWIVSMLLGAGIPSLAFTLFSGNLHRLLLMSTAPLVCFIFAAQLALQLPDYGKLQPLGRTDLMSRLGWQRGMQLHDLSILIGLLLLAISLGIGLPRRVVYGMLVVLPVGLMQVWYMNRIRSGEPPRWDLLRLSSIGLVGLTTYLQLAGYWLS